MQIEMLRLHLYEYFKNQIIGDLTTGREDNGLRTYNTEQIEEFLKRHKKLIFELVDEMIEENTENLEELENPERGWFREYLAVSEIYVEIYGHLAIIEPENECIDSDNDDYKIIEIPEYNISNKIWYDDSISMYHY